MPLAKLLESLTDGNFTNTSGGTPVVASFSWHFPGGVCKLGSSVALSSQKSSEEESTSLTSWKHLSPAITGRGGGASPLGPLVGLSLSLLTLLWSGSTSKENTLGWSGMLPQLLTSWLRSTLDFLPAGTALGRMALLSLGTCLARNLVGSLHRRTDGGPGWSWGS